MADDVSQEQMASMMTSYLASLPPERFPNIPQEVDHLMKPGREDRFEFGMDVLVRLASFGQ